VAQSAPEKAAVRKPAPSSHPLRERGLPKLAVEQPGGYNFALWTSDRIVYPRAVFEEGHPARGEQSVRLSCAAAVGLSLAVLATGTIDAAAFRHVPIYSPSQANRNSSSR